ncbi:hypothetical protein ABFX02_08G221300 [Erythranthe guttata]
MLFVRCYLPAGNTTRSSVILDSRESIMTSSSPMPMSDTTTTVDWNQTISLDCSGSKESIERLRQETLVLELRRRSAAPFVGRLRGSKLVGKAEVPWRTLLPDSTESMEIEKWIPMLPENGGVNVVNYRDKLPAVQMAMKISQRTERKKISGACGCVDGGYSNSCVDYEFFAIEAALEAL